MEFSAIGALVKFKPRRFSACNAGLGLGVSTEEGISNSSFHVMNFTFVTERRLSLSV